MSGDFVAVAAAAVAFAPTRGGLQVRHVEDQFAGGNVGNEEMPLRAAQVAALVRIISGERRWQGAAGPHGVRRAIVFPELIAGAERTPDSMALSFPSPSRSSRVCSASGSGPARLAFSGGVMLPDLISA
jgi:hypothetical protein